jgi:hypothetical protein
MTLPLRSFSTKEGGLHLAVAPWPYTSSPSAPLPRPCRSARAAKTPRLRSVRAPPAARHRNRHRCHGTPLPTQPTPVYPSVVFLGSPCTFSRRRRSSIGAVKPLQRAPAGTSRSAAAKARRSRSRPGQPLHPTQVSLLWGSSHPPGRGRPHITGRQPPLRRQDHIARIELFLGCFVWSRGYFVILKESSRVLL